MRALAYQTTEEPPGRLDALRRSKQWQIRLALAEGLRAIRHVNAVELLIKLVGDKSERVRRASPLART